MSNGNDYCFLHTFVVPDAANQSRRSVIHDVFGMGLTHQTINNRLGDIRRGQNTRANVTFAWAILMPFAHDSVNARTLLTAVNHEIQMRAGNHERFFYPGGQELNCAFVGSVADGLAACRSVYEQQPDVHLLPPFRGVHSAETDLPPGEVARLFGLLPEDNTDSFCLIDNSLAGMSLRPTRPNQGSFNSKVAARYGRSCMICGIQLPSVLDAAHVFPKDRKGSDDARNGIVICANHHRAFDAHLFGIEPTSRQIFLRNKGPTQGELQIPYSVLTSSSGEMPHRDALEARWRIWNGQQTNPNP